MATVVSPHIEVDENGVARIAGTRFKIQHLVEEYKYWGWTPDVLAKQHPSLSMAQIHAAFVYCYDHQAAIDAQIEKDEREMELLVRLPRNSVRCYKPGHEGPYCKPHG